MALNLNYSIQDALSNVEHELIDSMMRNLSRHRAKETKYGYNWNQWQVLQLEALQRYKNRNQKYFRKQFQNINSMIEQAIRKAYAQGGADEEIQILKALKKGFTIPNGGGFPIRPDFFRINEDKLNSLIRATVRDMEMAETAILRRSDDIYRRVIFNAQVYANTGAGTYEKAIDMATKDMLSAGIQCVEYKNGARHTLKNYASMAIRTAGKRAYLQGEGDKRKERGISTVILNKRGNPCPLCAPFVGKVFIDDVWSGGKASDGNYPLLSSAIQAGLYHPNCRDSHTTYFPGISTPPEGWTREELEDVEVNYRQNQRIRYAGRQVERFARLAAYALDPGNKRRYQARLEDWGAVANQGKTDILEGEQISEVPEVHTIGKIDTEIYKCITENIVTDEVIITDNQIRHIKERHPQDYQVILDKLKGIILNPEYIIRDKNPNTGLVIGNIFENGGAAQIVLRLATSIDERGYKNSIISYWRISAKRLQNYLRNKQVLYKKE